MTKSFSRSETIWRLRQLAKAHRQYEGMSKTSPVEIGVRVKQEQSVSETKPETFHLEGDDLDYLVELKYVDSEHVMQQGAIVHLYLSERGTNELMSVAMGWLGTKEESPSLINVDGRRV